VTYHRKSQSGVGQAQDKAKARALALLQDEEANQILQKYSGLTGSLYGAKKNQNQDA